MANSKDTSKQKKINVRVDFTPMVDMMMLLITFFMLCTSLAKPQTMELSMPSNDKNMTDQNLLRGRATEIRRSINPQRNYMGQRWNQKSIDTAHHRR